MNKEFLYKTKGKCSEEINWKDIQGGGSLISSGFMEYPGSDFDICGIFPGWEPGFV